jgi:multidrug efflux pump subunit AcrA (membrane-fusion protein)
MPKRKRHRSSSPPDPSAVTGQPSIEAAPAVDPAVAMFAERHRQQQEAERKSREAERLARRLAEERAVLLRAKDDAAARLKAVRRQGVIAPGEVEAAEAAYTAATADLVEAETGERPTWAPARPEPGPDVTPEPEPEPDVASEAADERSSGSKTSGPGPDDTPNMSQ